MAAYSSQRCNIGPELCCRHRSNRGGLLLPVAPVAVAVVGVSEEWDEKGKRRSITRVRARVRKEGIIVDSLFIV